MRRSPSRCADAPRPHDTARARTARAAPLDEATFASYAPRDVADPTKVTEAILVLGLENREQVDELVDKALAAGGAVASEPSDAGGMYQRSFFDLDGHQWAALCLVAPAG